MQEDASNLNPHDARNIARKIHLNWGHSSAQRLRRILADACSASKPAPAAAGEEVNQCDFRQAFVRAPHLAVAGTPLVSASNEKVQGDLLFLYGVVTLRAMGLFSKCSLLVRAPSGDPPG